MDYRMRTVVAEAFVAFMRRHHENLTVNVGKIDKDWMNVLGSSAVIGYAHTFSIAWEECKERAEQILRSHVETQKLLYICVYQHPYGVDTWVFWFVPTKELPFPSPRAVATYFNIDFEPGKGELFEVVLANPSGGPTGIETLEATKKIQAGEKEMSLGRATIASANWHEPNEEGWDASE